LSHWVACVVFRVPLALGMLGIFQPLDSSVLVIRILGGRLPYGRQQTCP
jgi:hypothetical protein